MCLICWNALLGASGSLLMCIHSEGAGHLVELQDEDECCHDPSLAAVESGEQAAHPDPTCGDCVDLELQSVDISQVRTTEPLALTQPVDLLVQTPLFMAWPHQVTVRVVRMPLEALPLQTTAVVARRCTVLNI